MKRKDNHIVLPKSESWRMFDQISPRYDFLNHVLSFGLDIHWRRRLARFIVNRQNLKILDLATGTADVLLAIFQENQNIQYGYGIDLSEKMLDIGRDKVTQKGLEKMITLKNGDAHQIPFEDNTFDNSTIAFGIRNMEDPLQVLREMRRVLNKQGRALILEFSLPENSLIRNIHLFYLRTLVPLIGGVIAGHAQAYRYLNQTIETFPYGDNFCSIMRKAGFEHVKAHPLMGGIATIYKGDKVLS